MYLPDVALYNLACLAKKGMLLIQEQFRLFLRGRHYRHNVYFLLQLVHNFTETVQLLACDFIEIVF